MSRQRISSCPGRPWPRSLTSNRHAEPVADSRYGRRQRLPAVRETYGLAIAPGEDDALLLAITVCIDALGERRD